MRYKEFSKITFGGASISGEGGGYGFGDMSEKEAELLIQKAWEAGITLFDTAPIYGFGLSEERLGRYLPKDATVISKSGVDWHQNLRVNMANDKLTTQKMLEQSLKRLNRDFIDIYMIHWPDQRIDIREPLEVLIKAQEMGKIKKIGLCNTNLEDLAKAEAMCKVEVLQSELNFFNQAPFKQLGDKWKDKFTMSWGTFDKGILTGRVTKDRKFAKSDCRSWAPWWNKKEVQEKILKVEKLQKIISDYNISLSQFCLHYNLTYFGVSTCLIGFKSALDISEVGENFQKKVLKETIEEILVRYCE